MQQENNCTQQKAAANAVTDYKVKLSNVAGVWVQATAKQCANTRQEVLSQCPISIS